MRSRPFRATALLVTALFLGGIGGAADLDALLFHGAGAPGAAATHYESTGSTHPHADNCLLTLRVASGRGSLPLASPVRFEGLPQHATGPLPVVVPPTFHPGFHQDSRAPPAALA
ncbi:MAG TPA: hypothetical protein VMF70_00870 [Gemmatimonadales bacterium]|nr:hypothetical protein [Gemmatimonadales bacterium]